MTSTRTPIGHNAFISGPDWLPFCRHSCFHHNHAMASLRSFESLTVPGAPVVRFPKSGAYTMRSAGTVELSQDEQAILSITIGLGMRPADKVENSLSKAAGSQPHPFAAEYAPNSLYPIGRQGCGLPKGPQGPGPSDFLGARKVPGMAYVGHKVSLWPCSNQICGLLVYHISITFLLGLEGFELECRSSALQTPIRGIKGT